MVDQSITILRIVKFVQSPCESLLIPRFNTNYPPVMVVNSIRETKIRFSEGISKFQFLSSPAIQEGYEEFE